MCAMLTYNMLDPDRIQREISNDSPDHHIVSIHQSMRNPLTGTLREKKQKRRERGVKT